MSLADIINRIASDAADESEHELSTASARAETILSRAESDAQSHRAATIEAAKREATLRAATLVASARLSARDRALTEKRMLVDAAFDGIVAALEALPAERYVRLIARGIASSARTGDTVSVAADDSGHLTALKDAVSALAPGLALEWASDPAPVSRGAVITGSRTRLEVTPRSLTEERRDELELTVAAHLFSGEGR